MLNFQGQKRNDAASTSAVEESEDPDAMCHVCEKSVDPKPSIQCDKCDAWNHLGCFKLLDEEAYVIETFYCPPCIVEHECKLEFVTSLPAHLGGRIKKGKHNSFFEALKKSVNAKMVNAVGKLSSDAAGGH